MPIPSMASTGTFPCNETSVPLRKTLIATALLIFAFICALNSSKKGTGTSFTAIMLSPLIKPILLATDPGVTSATLVVLTRGSMNFSPFLSESVFNKSAGTFTSVVAPLRSTVSATPPINTLELISSE
ncbi:hypothetical protein D3C72_1276170 [compost metagenome]